MTKCIIGFGKFYHLYLYIFYYAFCTCGYEMLLNFATYKRQTKIGLFGYKPLLNYHILIRRIYKNLGFIIFSYISYSYFKRKNYKKILSIDDNNLKSFQLIYDEQYISQNNTKDNDQKQLIIVGMIFGITLELYHLSCEFGFQDFDFWIFNLIFILLFIKKFYKMTIYSHQKFSLAFNFLVNLILLIIIMFINRKNNSFGLTEKIFHHELYCFLFIFFFIFCSFINCYGLTKARTLMEHNYVIPYKIIFITGFFGLLIISILLIFTSLYNCEFKSNTDCQMGGRYGVCNSCTVEDLDEKNTTDYYLDNFLLYFSNLKNKFNNNKYQFFSEIIIISPLFAILNYLRFLFELLIAFYLNPFYILIGDNLIFIIKYLLKSILFYSRIRGKVDDGDDPRDIKLEKVRLILSFVVQVVSCIFYLVFLEIIELRFCGLDENLKKNMEERGQLEAIRKSLDSSSDLVLGDDEDDDDNMNNDINDKKMEMSNY